MDMPVWLLVATIVSHGSVSRVTPAEQPFFRTKQECIDRVAGLGRVPFQFVDSIVCEPAWISPDGRTRPR